MCQVVLVGVLTATTTIRPLLFVLFCMCCFVCECVGLVLLSLCVVSCRNTGPVLASLFVFLRVCKRAMHDAQVLKLGLRTFHLACILKERLPCLSRAIQL